MNRNQTRLVITILLFAFAAALAAKSHLPAANTRAAIKSYVESAAKVISKHGPSCDTFKSADWMNGDYYIFVQGPDDRVVCHPNASLIGKPASDIIDSNGKKVGLELAAVAKKGGGWVEYVWPRPGTTKPVPKSSYAMRAKAPDGKWYTVGAGGYEVK